MKDKNRTKQEIRLKIVMLESLCTDFGMSDDEDEEVSLLNNMTMLRREIFELLEDL